MENSSSMQRGMAPPQGFAASGLRSKMNVSMPPEARASAADDPAGPPPMTAARSAEVMIQKDDFCPNFIPGCIASKITKYMLAASCQRLWDYLCHWGTAGGRMGKEMFLLIGLV